VGREGSQRGVNSGSDILLKTIERIAFIHDKSIKLRYNHYNQNKVDSRPTVKQNRDLLNLLFESWIYERFML